jgi:dTDP-4-dehydrorhamnose reductase
VGKGAGVRVFITGIKGQLGRALTAVLSEHTVTGGDLPDWDMLNAAQVEGSVQAFGPDVIIHTAALTNVDYCAKNPTEALRVNGGGAYNVALAARKLGVRLVAISSNEVFPGDADRPYFEYDSRRAINPYGASKLAAERIVERIAPNYQIVRTAWLYGPDGVNFIHKILERARSGQPLKVVTDEVSSPTYVVDLAEAIGRLIELDRPGIYHLVNAGACSRYDFAIEIVRAVGLDVPIAPITSEAFERASTPPPYAPLENVFGALAGVELRAWQEAVGAYIEAYE